MSQTDVRTLSQLKDEVVRSFAERFGQRPQWLVAAPGRVNLIGEHTDYNGGFVLPMAIDRYVVIGAAPSRPPRAAGEEPSAHVISVNMHESARIRLQGPISPGPVSWSSYVQGVVAGLVARGWSPPPFDALIQSTVPVGGGLSSSAALEVATATLLEAMCGQRLGLVDKALLCQKAEHTFAGVPCGIMDQFSSVMCRENTLMLLDCRSQEVQLVPFADPDVSVVIANTNVKHELTGGEYAKRRGQCEAAAKVLGVPFLRDVTREQLAAGEKKLDPVQFRRARHVVNEIERTVAAADALRRGDWSSVGEAMYASHASLKDDYEVSCEELDLMVDIARSMGPSGGVIGSRMTGGGFGGCTVSLLRTSSSYAFMRELDLRYREQTKIEPTVFATRPSQGAMIL